MNRFSSGACGVIISIVAACTPSAPPADLESSVDWLVESTLPIARSRAPALDTDGVLILVNARNCLTCQNIGRQFRDVHVPDRTVIAVGLGDSATVSEYLRVERVVAPTVYLDDPDQQTAIARLPSAVVVRVPDGGSPRWEFLPRD